MNTVLVTGATGFIGRHCLPLFKAQGYDVHGVSWQQNPESVSGITFHRLDLLDPGQTSKILRDVQPTHLLHLAWYAVPRLYWTSEENKRWLEASRHLIQQFQSLGGKRLVIAGTCAEYDWSLGTERFDEVLTPLAPATLYGQCKQSLDAWVESFTHETGMSAACGRIFMLYGPHEHPDRLVSGIIRGLLQRQPVPCSLGDQIRDVMYVKDVAAAFAALLDSAVSGPVNIATGEPLRVKDLIHRIATMLQGQSFMRFGERPMPVGEPGKIVADVRRLREDVGWHPTYTLDQGLVETISWWKQRMATEPLPRE